MQRDGSLGRMKNAYDNAIAAIEKAPPVIYEQRKLTRNTAVSRNAWRMACMQRNCVTHGLLRVKDDAWHCWVELDKVEYGGELTGEM